MCTVHFLVKAVLIGRYSIQAGQIKINLHLFFRNNSVAPIDQLLTALRYYGSGGHLMQTADFMQMHESTASRLIAKVSRALSR